MTKTPVKPAKTKTARAGTAGGGAGVIETALVNLIRDQPFYGHVLLGFQRHVTEMPEPIGMNITKTPNLFVNPAAFARYKMEEQVALLQHVCLHLINLHPMRVLMGWQPEVWHLACVRGETIIPGDYERIDRTQPGQKVFSSSGASVKVTGRVSRPYDGELVSIKATYLPEIEVTPDHPLLAVPFKMKEHHGAGTGIKVFGSPQWILAKDITRKHMLIVPKLKAGEGTSERDLSPFVNYASKVRGHHQVRTLRLKSLPIDAETAWMMGLYVADGSASGNAGIIFALDARKDGDIVARLVALFRERFRYAAKARIWKGRPNLLSFVVCSRVLMKAFAAWFGRGAHEKRIPDWLVTHPDEEIVRSFLMGYLAGDGCVHTRRNGHSELSLATVSERLSLQLQLMVARFAGLMSLGKRRQRPRQIRGRELPENLIYELSSKSRRVLAFFGIETTSQDPNIFAHDFGDFWLTRVRRVSAVPYSGQVYNIATEDQSYLVSNAVVHNCDLASNQFIENMPADAPQLADFPYLRAGEKGEDYYKELVKHIPPQPPPPPGGGRGKGKPQKPDPNAPPGEGDGDGEEGEAEAEGGGAAKKPEDKRPVDSAAHWAESTPDPEYLREVVRDLVKKATAQLTPDEWGHLPGDVKSLIEELKRPKENWKAVLDRFISFARMVVREESRKRPNRRFGRSMPGYATRPELHLVLCVDTSRSITDDDLAEFNGRMARLCEDVDVSVIECDADVQRVYKGRKKVDKEFFGRGGTNFIPALEKAREIDADAVIYLTDGLGDFPKRKPRFPVLWAVTPSGRQDRDFPFGRTMRLKFED